MRHIIYIAIISLLPLLPACSDDDARTMSALDHIENHVVGSRPDSALLMLEAMPPETLTSDRAVALHSLLLAQARHKCYVDQTDDSDITHATEYFRRHGDTRHAMLAQYYRAVIQEENQDYPNAIISAIVAEEYANSLNDDYFLAKINELYADIHIETFNIAQSLSHRKIGAELYKESGHQTNYICSSIDYARTLTSSNQYQKSIELLDSISPICQLEDSAIVAYHLSSYISPLIGLGNYDDAYSKYLKLKSYNDYLNLTSIDYENAYLLEKAKGSENEANRYLSTLFELANNSTDPSIEMALYEYYKTADSLDKAIFHLEQCFDIQNKKTEEILKQSTNIAERNYWNQKSIQEKHKSKNLMIAIVFLLIFVATTTTLSILYYRNRLKRKQLEIDARIREIRDLYLDISIKEETIDKLNLQSTAQEEGINSLSDKLSHKNIELQKLNALTDSLFKNRFSILNKLCVEYFEKMDSDKTRYLIYKGVERIINEMKSPASLNDLEATVNELRDGIMQKLDQQFPGLKKIDRTFLLLTFAGLPAKTICIICNLTIYNYYNKRQRLKARFEASETESKNLFIQSFHN